MNGATEFGRVSGLLPNFCGMNALQPGKQTVTE
jgi:hypothetical protein